MKNKPTKKEKEKELQHLCHLETCFLTLYVSLIVGGLSLYLTLKDNPDFQKIAFLIFLFSSLFSANHIIAIVLNNLRLRINAFMWDIGYFLMLIVVGGAAIIGRVIISLSEVYPSIDFIPISLLISIFIGIIGLVSVQIFITKRVHPFFRKKVLPALSYGMQLENPLVGKESKK
jgi:hypothetical protein